MKVLHIIDTLGLGGAQRVVKGIVEKNDDHFVYSLRKKPKELNIETQQVVIFKSESRLSLLPLFQIVRIIKDNDIHVLHCHLFRSQVFGFVVKMVRPKIKLIFHEHGQIVGSDNNSSLEDFLYVCFLKSTSLKVDAYIAVSHFIKERLLCRVGVPDRKIYTLYNFVKLDNFPYQGLPTGSDYINVGFAGRLVDRKGWVEFLSIAENLYKHNKKFRFYIAGDGADKERLLTAIMRSSIREVVSYVGHVSDMNSFYSKLSIFVMPSKWEGLPMAQLEVFASGPVLAASNNPGVNEVGVNGESCIYFDLSDIETASAKILAIAEDKTATLEMSQNARNLVLSYGLDDYCHILDNLYNNIVLSQSKVAVCFVSKSSYLLFNDKVIGTFGGAEVDMYNFSKELAKDSNFSVVFLVGDYGQPAIEIRQGVVLKKVYKNDDSKLLQLFKLLKSLFRQNSKYYFQESASGFTAVVALVCILFLRRYIYRSASDIDCNGSFIKRNGLEGLMFKFALTHTYKILVQTEKNRLDLYKTHGLGSSILKNGIVLEKSNRNKGGILWVGRSESIKEPHTYLDLVESLPQFNFTMICPKANQNSVDYELLQERAKTSKNLQFIHRVSYAETQRYFSEAEIFVNTSTYEGFPNTFVQAMAAHVVIASLRVNPDEFITINNVGICAYGNFSELRGAIIQIMSNDLLRKSLQDNAYCYAQSNNNIETSVGVLKKLLV